MKQDYHTTPSGSFFPSALNPFLYPFSIKKFTEFATEK
jgi:hypothetical protein